MTPTDTPTTGPLAALANNRPMAAAVLGVCALLWAAPLVYAGYRLAKPQAAEKKADALPELDEKKDDEAIKPVDPNYGSWVWLLVTSAAGVLVGAIGALWLAASTPPLTLAGRLTDVRKATLVCGGLFGLLLMAVGLWFFLVEYDTLSKWLTSGTAKDAWRVVLALLVFVLGAGLAFAAVVPARAEERNNQTVRRMVYGTSYAVTAVLLLMVLVIGNVVAGLKLPNALDTTESGFYTLAPSTEEFVRSLDQRVTVYATVPDDSERFARDIRQLLTSLQAINPDKFRVQFYGSTPPRAELQRLRAKFPQSDFEDYGITIAVGDDESRYSFVRSNDLLKQEGARGSKLTFQGEGKVIRELLFLAESKVKPVVYFTQGNGELALDAAAAEPTGREVGRPIGRVKRYLEENNVVVRPFTFDPKSPKVPDDAAVVVVADPRLGVPKDLAAALRAYMTAAKPDGKKGKLIVLAGPHPTANKGEVQPTGLEDLLADFNLRVRDAYLIGRPDGRLGATDAIVALTQNGVDARNPISLGLQEPGAYFIPVGRPIDPISPGKPEVQVTPLLITAGQRVTWLEKAVPADAEQVLQELAQNEELVRQREASRRPRVLAAAAAEGTSGRLVVVGSGQFFVDEAGRQARQDTTPGKLLALAIDYLRDRPPAPDVATKEYGTYTPAASMDDTRLKYLPLGVMVLAVASVGLGVWVVRRK